MTLRKERARSLIQTWPEYPKPPHLQTEQSYSACLRYETGAGIFPANMNVSPGYFHRKKEEKRIEPKEVSSYLIPLLLVLFSLQLEILVIALNSYSCRKPQFCSDSVWYQKKFFPLFVSRVFSQIWKGRILASSQQILIGYSLCSAKTTSAQSMLYDGTMWARSDQ